MRTQWRVVFVCWIFLSAMAGCASGKKDIVQRRPIPTRSLPVPADLRDGVERVRALGAAIYIQDAASAIASDVLVEQLGSLDGRDIGGWITVRDTDVGGRPTGWWLVLFFTHTQPARVAYEVRVPMTPGRPPGFRAVDPPKLPDRAEQRLIEARRVAIAALPADAGPRNTVMLPGEPFGVPGIFVYLLAASTEPATMTLGKHFRVTVGVGEAVDNRPNAPSPPSLGGKGGGVSEDHLQRIPPSLQGKGARGLGSDGATGAARPSTGPVVREVAELTSSALTVRLDAESTRLRPPFVKDLKREIPSEAYVLGSLLHRVPILLATSRGVWWIDGDRIEYLSDDPAAPPGDLID